MNMAKKIKSNLLIVFVSIAYVITFIYKRDLVILGLQNSIYYFKELVFIMPVVLMLTALLDFWVPKKVIITQLGNKAGIKVPMLVNEVAFLGPKFMIVRWILTFFAILIVSSITSKVVTDKDIVLKSVK